MNLVYIISPDFVKTYSGFINSNVDNDLIDIGIIEAQEQQLQEILGTDLYESILNKISGDTLSSDTVYNELVETFVVKTLVYYTLAGVTPRLIMKFNNKNIGTQDSDNTTVIGSEEREYLINGFNNKAAFYAKRLTDHLCYNSDIYPEYTSNTEDEMRPSTNSRYNVGMDLTSKHDRRR